ncbi:MAG: chitobiase/beta-hexosaminidase C-terminal domain-containing protein, partial [Phycisphaerales bacterium]
MGSAAVALGGVVYPDPAGGWTYMFTADTATAGPADNYDSLDGTWDHTNGSDAWDGSQIGSGSPGGVSALTEGATNYVRLQETGDPRQYGIGDPGSNRKIMLSHSINSDVGAAGDTILDDGVTISFRARISSGPPLDDLHAGGAIRPWPAGGDGYVMHDGGKSGFSVRQSTGDKLISFAPALASDDDELSANGLVMNKLNGTSVTGDVDLQGNDPGTVNILPIMDITAWHEFWITIQLDNTGTGTHLVKIWKDGSPVEEEFYVTAGSGSDYNNSYIAIGLGATPQSGAIDVDFFAYKLDVAAPAGGNIPPTVDAGNDQRIMLPISYADLDGTVEDDGMGEPNGLLAMTWSKVSGLGIVTFEPSESIEDPTVTFSSAGEYVLMLTASDGESENYDEVTITVVEPNCPVGDLNADCTVNFDDVQILTGQWLSGPGCSGFGCPDLDGTGEVDTSDYALLAQSWLQSWLGSLQVVISPQEAINAGAQWRVDGGPWRNSASRETDLKVGSHRVDFRPISDWILPEPQTVEISKNQVSIASGTYLKQPPSKLIISEFMANKGSSLITRVEGKWIRPDWIEIYNGTGEAVNLEGWYLTDNENNLTRWRFPSMIVNHGEYKVVFASEKDQKYYPGNYPYLEGGYYHTNFELDRGGEYLALVRPDGVTVAHEYEPKYPRQYGFVSYGKCSSVDKYGYFTNPTPGAENDTMCVTDVVADTKFSHDRGFCDAPFSVTIATETEGATICYTTDGSTPTETHSQVYAGPIAISTTTCLRAMAFKPGWLSTNVDTQTYIFLEDVIHQNGAAFPNTWGHAGADYEMDYVVVRAYSDTIKNDLKSVPTLSLVTDVDNWFGTGNGIYANPEW